MTNLPTRKVIAFPFHTVSVVAIAVCDWIIYVGNMKTHLDAIPAWVIATSLAAGVLTAVAERKLGKASKLATAVRALVATVLVAAPFPLLGTLVAAVALLWALGAYLLGRLPPRAPRNAGA